MKSIRSWWDGKHIPEPEGSPFVMGTIERHWTSKVAHILADFYLQHWKWIWGFTLALVGVLVKLAG